MKFLTRFLHSLRGRLILTYTAVTVLALLALEIIVLVLSFSVFGAGSSDQQQYFNDVIYTLYPQAQAYLQPGEEDLAGLQAWLERVYASGYASMQPQTFYDSPAAGVVPGSNMVVLSTEGRVLAEAPLREGSLVGQQYAPPQGQAAPHLLENALAGWRDPAMLSAVTPEGKYWFAVPVPQEDSFAALVGVILLTLEPPPPMARQVFPAVLGSVALTGLILLCAVAPFGAVFGLILSGGLIRRLAALTAAADAWSEGDFSALPADRKQDEIGLLGRRMRNMAERLQALLQDRQVLAQMEERNRLARDLHDTVKQQSFATLMQIRAARNRLAEDPAEAEQHLLEAESLVKASQQDLALMIAELRPAALADQGLEEALRLYLATWSSQACIPSSFDCSNARSLSLDVEQALYRVAQEALANVARHSRATAVRVSLVFERELVCLEIRDNGVGFDAQSAAAGYGLQSMRERLASVDGFLRVESSAEGTVVAAEIVLPVQ